jgi:hypothetical protein
MQRKLAGLTCQDSKSASASGELTYFPDNTSALPFILNTATQSPLFLAGAKWAKRKKRHTKLTNKLLLSKIGLCTGQLEACRATH